MSCITRAPRSPFASHAARRQYIADIAPGYNAMVAAIRRKRLAREAAEEKADREVIAQLDARMSATENIAPEEVDVRALAFETGVNFASD